MKKNNLEDIVKRSIKKEIPSPENSLWVEGKEDEVRYYKPESTQENGPFGAVLKYEIPDEWIKEFKSSLPSLRAGSKIVVDDTKLRDQPDRVYSTYICISLMPKALQEYLKDFKIRLTSVQEEGITAKLQSNTINLFLGPNHTGEWKYTQEKIVSTLGGAFGYAFRTKISAEGGAEVYKNAYKLEESVNWELFKSSDPWGHLFKFYVLSVYQAFKTGGEDFQNGRIPSAEETDKLLREFLMALRTAGAKDTSFYFTNILYMTQILQPTGPSGQSPEENEIQKKWDDKEAKTELKKLTGDLGSLLKVSNDADPVIQKKLAINLRLLPKELISDLSNKFSVIIDNKDHRGNILPTKEKIFKDHSVYEVHSGQPINNAALWAACGRAIYNYIYAGMMDHKRMADNNPNSQSASPIERVLRKFIYSNYHSPVVNKLKEGRSAPELDYFKYTKPAELNRSPDSKMFLPSALLGYFMSTIMKSLEEFAARSAAGVDEHMKHKVFEEVTDKMDQVLPGVKNLLHDILGKYFKV